MAQNENIFTRLGKLFQNNIIVRQTPTGKLKVITTNIIAIHSFQANIKKKII